jgi:hypothetical protein
MNAPQLLETLTARGARLSLDGAALVIKPRDVLTDALRAEIRANKSALLVLLQHGDRFAESSAPAISPEAPATEPTPDALFWRDVATAIEGARRGQHLAYTPALAWAWQAVNAMEKRDLTSAQLCALATKNTQGDSK